MSDEGSAPEMAILRTAIRQELEALEKRPRVENGGGGGHTGGMDAWQTSVENRLSGISTDIRHLWYAFVAGGIILAGLTSGIYLWTGEKFEKVDTRLDRVEQNMVAIQKDVSSIRRDVSSLLDTLGK